jgi:cysteine synthase
MTHGVQQSILGAIGNTPLVFLRRLSPVQTEIYAKLEGANPTGSVKDRPALYMVNAAERIGELTLDHVLLEPTSGNMGLSLAMIARVKGYRLRVVVPENVPQEKLLPLAAFGADIVHSNAAEGSNGAIAVAHQVDVDDRQAWMLNQYSNQANVTAHYHTTAAEVLADLPDLTAFVAGLGSSGTLMGVSRRLKEYNPTIDVIAAEPMPGELVQGLRSLSEGFVPPIFDASRLDGRMLIEQDDALTMTRRLVDQEGILAGPSSGAALTAAVRYAESHPRSKVVVLLADGGWKYLSTGLFGRERQLEESLLW